MSKVLCVVGFVLVVSGVSLFGSDKELKQPIVLTPATNVVSSTSASANVLVLPEPTIKVSTPAGK